MSYYIAPNSTLHICRGVPLDNTHRWSYRPSTLAAQFASFEPYFILTLDYNSYTRATTNSIVISTPYEDILGANYLIFKNTSFENKYFYAFIDNTEYVNNNATRIYFTIDDFQSWIFDCMFYPSFVEREHTITDNIGDNIVPEPKLTSSDYLYSNVKNHLKNVNSGYYTVLVTSKSLTNPGESWKYSSTNYGAMFSGCYNLLYFTPENENNLIRIINQYIVAVGVDGILAMYTVPTYFFLGHQFEWTEGGIAEDVNLAQGEYYYFSAERPFTTSELNGYKPRNRKLYTAPFCYCALSISGRWEKTYKFEKWKSDDWDTHFVMRNSGVAPDCEMILMPHNYDNFEGDNYGDALSFSAYPPSSFLTSEHWEQIGGSWYGNLLKAIVDIGQGKSPSTLGTALAGGLSSGLGGAINNYITPVVSAGLSGGRSAAGGAALTTSLGALSTSMSNFGNSVVEMNRPSQFNGGATGFLPILTGSDEITTAWKSLTPQNLAVYDDYFDMYGYAVNRLKPITALNPDNHRPFYGYTKTSNCVVNSLKAPADAVKNIASYFDNGICLWYDLQNVGKYVLDNYPD